MSDTYYAYCDVKNLIVHRLFKLNGWKVYGWKADESDAMTDYWDPEYWSGIAEKNGYIFVVDRSSPGKLQMGKRYVEAPTMDAKIAEKIRKLEAVTMDRGASEQEEQTAKATIETLKQKSAEEKIQAEKTAEEYIMYPAHLANPPRCNWHVEKDGIIVAKGTGLLKFARIPDITNEREQAQWQRFNNQSKEEYIEQNIRETIRRWGGDEKTAEQERKYEESRYESAIKKYNLLEKFNEWISSVDTICGSQVGEPEYEYQKVKVTEYKKVNKAIEKSQGELKAGQHFVLKASFNYGCRKGLVYRIDSVSDKFVRAYKMNGKLTKMCTGQADRSNSFWVDIDRFMKWIEKGAIAWCQIEETKEPFEVEKVVKVPLKKKADADKSNETKSQESKGESEMAKKKANATAEEVRKGTEEVVNEEVKTEATATEEPANETPQEESGIAYKMQDGTREGATEVYFDEKPADEVLTRLKELRMRWHNKKKCWYGFADRKDIKAAIEAA